MVYSTFKKWQNIGELPQSKALTPKQNPQKLMTDIGGGWYMKKVSEGLTPLKRSKISKK